MKEQAIPKVTRKGQVTLPKWIRDELGLVPGSEVELEVAEGQAVLREKVSQEKLARWRGYLRGKLPGESVDTFLGELRGERPRETTGS